MLTHLFGKSSIELQYNGLKQQQKDMLKTQSS